MDSAQILVTLGGAALILFTLWFFFGKQEESVEKRNDGEDSTADVR